MHRSPASWFVAAATACIALFMISTSDAAQQDRSKRKSEKTSQPAAGAAVLDTLSVWRIHAQLAPPVNASGEKLPLSCYWMSFETPPAAADWMKTDFDDRFWHRGPLLLVPKTALLAKACLRGKFTVTDPAAVKGLKLSVTYNGGLIVYVNGRELRREHVQPGKLLADGPGGEERNLAGCEIPPNMLQKGMNVIGLEFVCSAYPKEGQEGVESGTDVYNVNCAEVKEIRLQADGDAGLVPNVGRPEGLQVWTADPLAVDYSLDFGDRAEPLRPVTIIAARNGLFSGKLIVGSSKPMRGLKVTAGDLKGPGGRIPADAVRFRFGLEWGEQSPRENSRLNHLLPFVQYDAKQFNALAPTPPEETPVKPLARAWYREKNLPETVAPTPGAIVPVWLTVKTPADLKPGTYAGAVRVEAEGESPIEAPIEVRVADWTLPDVQDYRTWVDAIQCPDTLAMEYDVPLWSEKHWAMIAESFRLIGETGCRVVYIPLLAHTNLGNEESMVQWVKKGDRYDYDFSIMERYLDAAEKNMGRPKLLIFVVWDVYMLPKDAKEKPHGVAFRVKSHLEHMEKIGGQFGLGPMVTVQTPGADGKVSKEPVIMPSHLDPAASKPLWKPLFDELHQRLKKRNMDELAMLGLLHDTWATKPEVEFFQDVTGNMPWVIQSHGGPAEGEKLYKIAPIGYQAVVWDVRFSDDGADGHGRGKGLIDSLHGWNRKVLWSQFERWTRETHPPTRWLTQAEVCITGAQRGPGRLGCEYWKVIKDKKGKRTGRCYERYPESDWRNLVIPEAMMAPGPDGAVATNQMEALRLGVQECETIIAVERALVDEKLRAKLGDDLVQRCERYLHARHQMMWLALSNLQFYHTKPGSDKAWETTSLAKNWRNMPNVTGHNWFLGSGHQERTAELFALAGEVTRKLGP